MMRFSQTAKLFGVAGAVAIASTGALVGCNGGGSNPLFGGGGNNQLTGRLTTETVPLLLVDYGMVYGSKDFADALDNFALQSGSAANFNRKSIQKPATGQAESTGCPVVTSVASDFSEEVAPKRKYTYNGCVPRQSTQAATGEFTIQFFDLSLGTGDPGYFNRSFDFSALNFLGKEYQGHLEYIREPTNPVPQPDVPPFSTEEYRFEDFSIKSPLGKVTYNGKQTLTQPVGQSNGNVDVEMTIESEITNATFQSLMELTFVPITSPGPNGTVNVDARLSGTATISRQSDNAAHKGAFSFELQNVTARDACNSADSGTMIIKGANGQAQVTFGPGCGQARYSINGGPEQNFDATQAVAALSK